MGLISTLLVLISGVTFVGVACAQREWVIQILVQTPTIKLIDGTVSFFLRAYALWNASRVVMVFLILLAAVSPEVFHG